MTKADLAGSTVIGEVVVWIVTRAGTGGDEGVGGCDRSKPVAESWSQKFFSLPMTAKRCSCELPLVAMMGVTGSGGQWQFRRLHELGLLTRTLSSESIGTVLMFVVK